jgi:hypothetical protein
MTEKKSWQERLRGYGNIFTPHAGSMVIHVHRESGLAHRTMTLFPWQVQALRLLTSKWFLLAVFFAMTSWGYFALQTARVPFLKQRLAHMEEDARRLDTLQARLGQLQARYEQVRRMLSTPSTDARRTVKAMKVDSSGVARPD